MNASTSVDSFLELELEFSIEEEKPCEHSRHFIDTNEHSGNGEWYVLLHCPSCEDDAVLLFCDTWISFQKQAPSRLMKCPTCDYRAFGYKNFYRKIWKKGDNPP